MRDKVERAFGSSPASVPVTWRVGKPQERAALPFGGAARNSLSEPDPGTAPVLGDEFNTGLFQCCPDS